MTNSLDNLSGNLGGPVSPSSTNNISIIGDQSQGIQTVGNSSSYTLTVSALDATFDQKGVSEIATIKEAILGVSSEKVVTAQGVSAKIGPQTKGAVAIGKGAGLPISWSAPLLDGQILIGSSSGNPAVANLKAGDGIVIQNSSGSIQIGLGGNGTPVSWSVIADNQTIQPQNGYFVNSSTSILLGLPPTSKIGDIIEIASLSTGGWKIVPTTGQKIILEGKSTPVGTRGYLSSSTRGDWVRLVCAQDNTVWMGLGVSGNITVT